MKTNISKRLFSNKLRELLFQEIDVKNSEINRFIDNIALNIILSSLSQQKRIAFYKLLEKNNYHEAKNFIKTEIPDFNKQILNSVRKKFK